MVDERAALLGRLLGRRRARARDRAEPGPVGAVCLQRTAGARRERRLHVPSDWHFPNRTPDRCGWDRGRAARAARASATHYCTRFKDAWAAAQYVGEHLARLEAAHPAFATRFARARCPAAVKDAATANLSTLVTQTCFRTADGEFHGFEGCADTSGCCFGNCTHVWNYETATAHLFPELARSLRRAAFGYSMDDAGGMRFRQLLPDGEDRFPHRGRRRADGPDHEGLSGLAAVGRRWLAARVSGRRRSARIAFAWIPNGWDADRDGVLEGAQHNTYDIEFYGPNPLCGIYYLGALRAVEEMARADGDQATRARGAAAVRVGPDVDRREPVQRRVLRPAASSGTTRATAFRDALLNTMGSDDTERPEYQMGDGCLVDQLVGQYQAEVAGLGPARRPGPLPDDAREHLPLQLQARPVRARERAADVRAERRGRRSSSPPTPADNGPRCRFRTTPRRSPASSTRPRAT